MNMLFNFVHMPDHIRDMSFHLMNRYFYSNFTVHIKITEYLIVKQCPSNVKKKAFIALIDTNLIFKITF